MPRNGDIRSFFAGSQASRRSTPAPARSSPPPPPPPAAAMVPPDAADLDMCDAVDPESEYRQPSYTAAPPTPHPDDMESFTSSPPSAAVRRTYARDAVIAASDEDDGFDSDGSALTDVFHLGGPSRGKGENSHVKSPAKGSLGYSAAARITTTATTNRLPETPRAKRTIPPGEFIFSSPLTIQSKKHKYDMAALLRMNEKDEVMMAFEEQMEKEKAEEERHAAGSGAGAAPKGEGLAEDQTDGDDDGDGSEDEERKAARQLKERMLASANADAAEDDGADGAGAGKRRVLRALERTDLSAGRKTYYFFEQAQSGDHALAVGGFPDQQARDVWTILADPQDRAKHFRSGFPFDIQKMFGNMPDEIFLWILDEVCRETRRDLAMEYVNLVLISDAHVRRLVTPARLVRLFRSLGATKDVERLLSSVTLRDEVSDSYRTRSWVCVENLLGLLGGISQHLSSEARITAMQILLRMGMDNIAVENFGLAQEWRWAVDFVARSVPCSEWTNFCKDVCTAVHQSTEKATLRYRAICLLGPVQRPTLPLDLQTRTLDLKRRLASVFFFDDLVRAGKKPEDTVNIRAVIDRLEENPFIINANTDYRELHALMMMLNIALGDASSQQIATSPESCQDFDAEVDELAEGIKSMLTRVAPQNKGIHVTRIEAKSAMEMLRERLLFQVRTKPKPKIKGIRLEESEEDTSVPRQQDFMKGFFLQKGKKMAGVDSELVRPSIERQMVA